jgi:hypothetical protein
MTNTPARVATRPATVTLTAANIEHLKRFPRPPRDNGIGLHFHLDLRDEFIAQTVERLQSIRATWTMIYAQDALQARRAADACVRAGIMPLVRIGKLINEPYDPEPFVTELIEPFQTLNSPPYIQIFNEPEDPREWVGGIIPDDWRQIFGRNWAHQADIVYRAGGFPGLQVLTSDAFDAAVDAVKASGREEIWERTFFVQHNYGANHPPAYPYDARNQADNPGQTILEDTLSGLGFLAYAAWMKERIGFVLPIVGGEGGWLFGAEEDKRYPKVEEALHAQYHREMFEWLRTGVLANGEPLPDYVFSIIPWIVSSWTFGGQNWWDNPLRPDGKLTQTIEAVQAMEPFERRFSWQGSTTGDPDPDPDPGSNPEPDPGTPITLPTLRKGEWIDPFNIQVVRNEDRPDRPQGDVVYRLVDLWTTRDGSWDPDFDIPGRLPAWARDTYLRPSGAPDYFDDAGGDHHLFARVLDLQGRPVTTPDLVLLWSDGLQQLGNPSYEGYVRKTPKSGSGWANQDVYAKYDHTRGERGPWSWCPAGAADVVTGGGMPGMGWHVSFFAVWQAQQRQASNPVDPELPEAVLLETIRRSAWDSVRIPFNPEAAIGRYARAHNLGVPMTGEFDVAGRRCQGFANGIVYVPIGQWDQVRHIAW